MLRNTPRHKEKAMRRVDHEEDAFGMPGCQLRIGSASWAEEDPDEVAMKFAWRDRNGHVVRGGEFPSGALPRMLEFAIKSGALTLTE
jgi:hypothetical protein